MTEKEVPGRGGSAGRRNKDLPRTGWREGRGRGLRAARLPGGRACGTNACLLRQPMQPRLDPLPRQALTASPSFLAEKPRERRARSAGGGKTQGSTAAPPPIGAAAVGTTHRPRGPPEAPNARRRRKRAWTPAPAPSRRLPAPLGGSESPSSRWFPVQPRELRGRGGARGRGKAESGEGGAGLGWGGAMSLLGWGPIPWRAGPEAGGGGGAGSGLGTCVPG